MFTKLPFLQDTATDDGADLSGLDRGDTFVPPGSEPDTDTSKDDVKSKADEKEEKDVVGEKDKDDKKDDKKEDKKDEKDDEKDEDEKDEKDDKKEDKKDDKKDEKDEEEDPPRRKDGTFAPKTVPASRLAEVSRRARAEIEARDNRIKELEAQSKSIEKIADKTAIEKEIEKLETDLEAARVDNNKERVLQLSKDIRLKERQINLTESTTLSAQAREAAKEDLRFEITVDSIEEKYPAFNPKSEAYDSELVDEVLFLKEGMQAKGLSPTAALLKAITYVKDRLEPKNDDKKDEKDEKDEKKDGLKKDSKVTDRSKKQVEKNLDTTKKQPGALDKSGADSDKKGGGLNTNVNAMTEDEFSALPDATKARMRGDFVE